MAKVELLTLAPFLDALLNEYEEMQDWYDSSPPHPYERHRPLPVVVGAGISASAGIPQNSGLLKTLGDKLSVPDATYQTIYEAIKKRLKKTTEPSQTEQKNFLRNLLAASGISREDGRVFPNVSNIAVVHLLRHRFFGPVISLNVDPLLSISGKLTETENSVPIRYLVNISQFSDLAHRHDGGFASAPLVFQPHGTIEEPLSLRFLAEEMLDQEEAIVKAVQNAVRRASAMMCVGSSLYDGVTYKIVQGWAEANDQSTKSFFVTFHGAVIPDGTRGKLASLPGNVTVNCLAGTDSDLFFRTLVEACVKRTKRDRANSTTRFHVPPISQALLRDQVFRALHRQETGPVVNDSPDARIPKSPSIENRLVFEIGVAALTARGPVLLSDLVESPRFGDLLNRHTNGDGDRRPVEAALRRLCQHRVISYLTRDHAEHFVPHQDFPPVRSIRGVYGVYLVRERTAADVKTFAQRLSQALGLRDPVPWVEDLMRDAEQDSDSVFIPTMACVYGAVFRNATLIQSHELLDLNLDKFKTEFEQYVRGDEPFECCIITETGGHLFRPDKLDELMKRRVKDVSEKHLTEALREWLRPIYLSRNDRQGLRIIVARREPDWLLEGNEHQSRRKWDAIVGKLLRLLAKAPRVEIFELPWEQHVDHMWFYCRTDKTGADASRGIFFPKISGRRALSAVLVEGSEDVARLRAIFHDQEWNSSPYSEPHPSHVVALTIVDGGTLGRAGEVRPDTQMLVVVRSPDANRDHKNIACVPTKRVPASLFRDIVAYLNVAVSVEAGQVAAPRPAGRKSGRASAALLVPHRLDEGEKAVREVVENILARKRGLADALELGQVVYHATPQLLKRGYSPKLDAGDSGEYVCMANVLVVLTKGKDCLLPKTGSYSRIEWVAVDEFVRHIQKEMAFSFKGDDFKYQTGGVCVCTSELLLNSMVESAPPGSNGAVRPTHGRRRPR